MIGLVCVLPRFGCCIVDRTLVLFKCYNGESSQARVSSERKDGQRYCEFMNAGSSKCAVMTTLGSWLGFQMEVKGKQC